MKLIDDRSAMKTGRNNAQIGSSRPHQVASQANEKRLSRNSGKLAVAGRRLKQEIVKRKAAEKALKTSELHHRQSLKQSQDMREELRYLSHQLLSAQEEERKEISRELHDQIAQTLTGINVHLTTLKKEAAVNAKGLDRQIARTQKLVEHAVNIVHRFARELRPAVLDDLGLITALRSFMENFTKRTGIRTRLTAFAEVQRLDNARRTVLFRVAQEALGNVARHAKASRVVVNIQKLPDCIWMKIKDDGKGFQVQNILFAKRRKRLGLLGMRERIEMIGGCFSVVSAPGKGTTVHAQVPLSQARLSSNKNPLTRPTNNTP